MARFSVTKFANDLWLQQQDRLHPEEVEARRLRAIEYQKKQDGYDASTLPTFSKVVMLWMHESQVKRALCARLLDGWNCYPSRRDFDPLIERGLCEWKPGKRQHDLTPAGVIAVKKLEQQLCARFNIHELIEGARTTGPNQRFACTCGKEYSVRRSTTAWGNARAQWAREHATEAGITKLYDAMAPVAKVGA